MIVAEAPIEEYSDEAWAARVGGVSGQHVGRLRRVFERFSATHDDYKGLYWSHFQAANEWADAEMWLEGAVQNDWSVAGMRQQRAEALGEIVVEDPTLPETWDEDSSDEETSTASLTTNFAGESGGPAHEGPDFGDDDESPTASGERSGAEAAREDGESGSLDTRVPINPLRPFAELPALPLDLNEAFEELKLAILRHKVTNWQEVGPSAIQDHLNAPRPNVARRSIIRPNVHSHLNAKRRPFDKNVDRAAFFLLTFPVF
ncbi:MAG: hypothetical protein QM811_05770 [Pirellulales bacterium]